MSWSFDRYGNRLTQVRNGSTQTLTPSSSTNRLSGYTYDNSGNVTNDGSYGILWDAEGRMVQYAANVTYAYDGNSLRTKKTNGTATIFVRSGAATLAEYNPGAAPNSPSREYIYSGGQLIASKAAGTYQWYVRDHLSTRAVYDETTASLLGYGHLPFGESWYGSSSEKWRFTSYERESDISEDYATFRQYQYGNGRFTSPDLIPGQGADPQSWNRYTYVTNDPLNLEDVLGLDQAGYCAPSDGNCGAFNWYYGGGGSGSGGGGGFAPAAYENFARGLYRYLFNMQTGFDPSQCGYRRMVSGIWCSVIGPDGRESVQITPPQFSFSIVMAAVRSGQTAWNGPVMTANNNPEYSKDAICQNEANRAALAEILPGGEVLIESRLSPGVTLPAVGEQSIETLLDNLATKPDWQKVVKDFTGLAKGRVALGARFFGYAMTAYTGWRAMGAAQETKKSCMKYLNGD